MFASQEIAMDAAVTQIVNAQRREAQVVTRKVATCWNPDSTPEVRCAKHPTVRCLEHWILRSAAFVGDVRFEDI